MRPREGQHPAQGHTATRAKQGLRAECWGSTGFTPKTQACLAAVWPEEGGLGPAAQMKLLPSRLGPAPPSTSGPAGASSPPLLTRGTLPTGPRDRPQGCQGCGFYLLREVLGTTAVGSLSR